MANERKLLALTDAQLRALKSLIRTEIVRTRPKKPKKKWLVPGGAGDGKSEIAIGLAKMTVTAPPGSGGDTAGDRLTPGRGKAHLYVRSDDGLALAKQPEGQTEEESEAWKAYYLPEVENYDSAVSLNAGKLVWVYVTSFVDATTAGGGGGEETPPPPPPPVGGNGGTSTEPGGGGGEEVPPPGDGGIVDPQPTTKLARVVIAQYYRLVDYLAALNGFAADTHLISEGSEASDIKWAVDPDAGSGDCETIQVVTDVTCNNGSLNVTKGTVSVITCDPNGGVP